MHLREKERFHEKNMDSFAIYPLVVLEGRTTVTVVSKMSCDGTESGIDYWESKDRAVLSLQAIFR